MNIRQICLLICSFMLLSCQTSPETRHISSDEVISLNKAITIPALQSHITIQFGEIINNRDLKAYETSCIVENDELGPRTIQQQRYTVSKVTYNEEMFSDSSAVIRYFIEIYLKSSVQPGDQPGDQQKNLTITCQTLDDTMRHHSFPVDEIKQATGDYFMF